ncbi:hypothetical protein A2714_02575 [Candidatus Woesebacteria bacterium RIFCSPHIGHO2_01_FULL_38_9]|uniref:Polysaccharide biosynthesis protein C-terminal domain-containing protein n=2 Tax=Candidatus Woeseibacteriota TaxID=1752722 RepID=A0A1F7Y210_9BACT|nr:MAG: hypothetical protein A2714_02575 [Candidatus Woesebacteria bacterium RIFCSPHIGHO2_01_FULL_38_9]OGM60562.1 MAG: hypothetical protein A3A75_03495 [Candidatus Woesebacteria bacterium RIFCSPLOWO2_01_FULL_39_10]
MINKFLNLSAKFADKQFSIFNNKFSVNYFLTHPLFSGSAVMIMGSNFANFIAYMYHLIVGRLLGPASYGELAAVISVLGLIFTSLNFIGLVVVKFASSANERELKGIYSWFSSIALKAGIGLSIAVLILTPFFSNFLHINKEMFFLLVPILSFSVLTFVYRSFLQGLMRFKEVVISSNADFVARLILGVIFIYAGLSAFGAMLGILLSSVIAFLILRHYLRDYRILKISKKFSNSKQVFSYAIPIFFATVATNSMFSTDVVLVKHFFNSHDAGIYASISTLGKIIFFGAGPVGAVMFPMISKRHAKGQNYSKIFILSLMLTLAIGLGVLFIYLIFPRLSISLLFGEKFIEGAPLLIWMGIFMVLFTLGSLILSYFLSIEKTKVTLAIVVAALMQGIGIWLFHDTLLTVINVSIASSSFFLVSVLIYFGYATKKKRN